MLRVRPVPMVPPSIVDSKKGVSYEKGKFMGKGVFGFCFEIKNKNTGEVSVAKVIPKSSVPTRTNRNSVANEIRIQTSLDHRNILQCCDFFEHGINYYIILKMCEMGNLWDMVHRRKELTEQESFYFGRHILSGLEYLHRRSVIHLDLKPDNILLDGQMVAKIADFGKALVYNENMTFNQNVIPRANSFTAPENIGAKRYSPKTDIWSLGCILYFLQLGSCPFDSLDYNELVEGIKDNFYTFHKRDMTDEFRAVIMECLAPEPKLRPTANPEVFRRLAVLYPESLVPYSGLPVMCLQKKPNFPIFNNPLNNTAHVEPLSPSLQEPQDRNRYLPEVFRQLNVFLAGTLEEEFLDRTPAKDPEFWIKDWHLLKNGRCLVYALSDHSFGIYDNCYGNMIMNYQKTAICVQNSNEARSYSKGEKLPEIVKTRMEYMIRIRKRHPVRGKRGTMERRDVKLIPFVKQCNVNSVETNFVFHLSNDTIQFAFKDVGLLVAPELRTVTFVHKTGKWDTHRLNGPREKMKPEYSEHLAHARKIVACEMKQLKL